MINIKLNIKSCLLLVIFLCGISNAFAAPAPPYDIIVTDIRFIGGGGIGPTSNPPYNTANYYRAYGVPGTVVEITAVMDVGGTQLPMYGDVSLTVHCSQASTPVNAIDFTLTIRSGENKGTASIPYDNASGILTAWIAANSTEPFNYTVSSASGINTSGTVTSTTSVIYWDKNDVPDDANFPPPLATDISTTTTTNSIRISWNPTITNLAAPYYNDDFYEYRLYYKKQSDTNWRIWNGANDSTLRGVSNNPATAEATTLTDSTRHFDAGRKYTILPNLEIFTNYDFYITAVDTLGNETPKPGTTFVAQTQPYSIAIIIGDGITEHRNFTDLTNPALRTLRESNIRIELYIITSETLPDAVKVWYTIDGAAPDIVDTATTPNQINSIAFAPDTLFSVEAKQAGPNKWVAYLTTKAPIIKNGNSIRFIAEATFSGVPVFTDADLSDDNPNDDEWNFLIGTPVTFSEQPVQMLNNVITIKNPYSYPAYYLTEDAYVTITIYDIKGQPVKTILDNAFRRGGQNIKEKGWDATNKSENRVGPGLYFVEFTGTTAGKKEILHKVIKVVVAE